LNKVVRPTPIDELNAILTSAGVPPIDVPTQPLVRPVAPRPATTFGTPVDDNCGESHVIDSPDRFLTYAPILRYRRLTTNAPAIIPGRYVNEFLIVQHPGRMTIVSPGDTLDTELTLALPEGFNASLVLPSCSHRNRISILDPFLDSASRNRLRVPLHIRKCPWQIQPSTTIFILRLEPIPHYLPPAVRARLTHDSMVATLRSRLVDVAAGRPDPGISVPDLPLHAPRVDQSFTFDASWLIVQNRDPKLLHLTSTRVSLAGVPTVTLLDSGSTQTSIDYAYFRQTFPRRRRG